MSVCRFGLQARACRFGLQIRACKLEAQPTESRAYIDLCLPPLAAGYHGEMSHRFLHGVCLSLSIVAPLTEARARSSAAGALPSAQPFSCDRVLSHPIPSGPELPKSAEVALLQNKLVVLRRASQQVLGDMLDVDRLTWLPVAPLAPPLYQQPQGSTGSQIFPLKTRYLFVDQSAYILDPEQNRWTVAKLPAGFYFSQQGWAQDRFVGPGHWFDAENGRFHPRNGGVSPSGGNLWIAGRGRLYSWSPGSAIGRMLDPKTGGETEFPAAPVQGFARLAPPQLLASGHVLLLGELSSGQLATVLFDPAKAAYHTVASSGGPDFATLDDERDNFVVGRFFVHHRPGYQDPFAGLDATVQTPDPLYVLDAQAGRWKRLQTMAQATVYPLGPWLLALSGQRARVHDPATGQHCDLPSKRLGYDIEHGGPKPLHVFWDAAHLVFFGQTVDRNPRCPPGAPCIPHRDEEVAVSNRGQIVTIAP